MLEWKSWETFGDIIVGEGFSTSHYTTFTALENQ
jgi:hypothetical protein